MKQVANAPTITYEPVPRLSTEEMLAMATELGKRALESPDLGSEQMAYRASCESADEASELALLVCEGLANWRYGLRSTRITDSNVTIPHHDSVGDGSAVDHIHVHRTIIGQSVFGIFDGDIVVPDVGDYEQDDAVIRATRELLMSGRVLSPCYEEDEALPLMDPLPDRAFRALLGPLDVLIFDSRFVHAFAAEEGAKRRAVSWH